MSQKPKQPINLIGVPTDCGASQRGASMGPASLRTAGIHEALADLGYSVNDQGDLASKPVSGLVSPYPHIRNLDQVAGWTRTIKESAYDQMKSGALPLYLGGDHSLSMGTIAGAAAYAKEVDRPQFVLWLDAHADFNTFETTDSGNIHGTPVAFLCGLPGFETLLDGPLETTVDPKNVCMLGIRSVDDGEHDLLLGRSIRVFDMRKIDEQGISGLMGPFLEDVARQNGLLHVSFDVDFLEPDIAPAVGTTVPGGATFREAHLVMEMLHDSGLVSSVDVTELNPFLDERGRTALLMVDLLASLFGRRVMGRQTMPKASRSH